MEKQKRQRNTRVVEKTVMVADIGKMPPQAPELEEAVLGALMLEKDAFSIISDILKPESFYSILIRRFWCNIQFGYAAKTG